MLQTYRLVEKMGMNRVLPASKITIRMQPYGQMGFCLYPRGRLGLEYVIGSCGIDQALLDQMGRLILFLTNPWAQKTVVVRLIWRMEFSLHEITRDQHSIF